MYTYIAFWASNSLGTTATKDLYTYGQLICYCGEFEIETTTAEDLQLSVRCVKIANSSSVVTLEPVLIGQDLLGYTMRGIVNASGYCYPKLILL